MTYAPSTDSPRRRDTAAVAARAFHQTRTARRNVAGRNVPEHAIRDHVRAIARAAHPHNVARYVAWHEYKEN